MANKPSRRIPGFHHRNINTTALTRERTGTQGFMAVTCDIQVLLQANLNTTIKSAINMANTHLLFQYIAILCLLKITDTM